jgi:hypothetical protein
MVPGAGSIFPPALSLVKKFDCYSLLLAFEKLNQIAGRISQ